MRGKKVHLLPLLLLFLAAGRPAISAVSVDSATREAQAGTYFAINGSKVFHIPSEMDGLVAQRLEWMKELGILWDRSDWWWHVIEPEPGRFDFSLPDRIVERFEAAGVQIYPILCYGAAWFEQGKTGPTTEEERRAFAEYVYQTVSRYKEYFTYWSVWNEPNILPFWAPEPNADDYAALLKVAYQAAKRADPECKICAPVVAPLQGYDRKFIERLYQLGCGDFFDVFDYHYYRNQAPEAEVPGEIASIQALMRRYGDEKPIWISETGVSSPIEQKRESYQRQAALIVRNHLLCYAAGVERIFYFDLQNWNDDPGASWDSSLGLVEAGGTRKPSFFAYQTMVKEIDYKEVLGRCRNWGDDVESVLIYDPKRNEFSLAVWLAAEEGKRRLEVVCEPGDVKIVHPYGDVEVRPLRQPALPGERTRSIGLDIDPHPRFIHSVDRETYLPEVAVRLWPEQIEAVAGERQTLRLEIDPLMQPCRCRVLDVRLPDGFEWNEKRGRLTIGEEVGKGTYLLTVEVEVTFGEGRQQRTARLEKTARVEVFPLADLTLRPYLEGEQLQIQAAINNQSSRSLSGTLELRRQAAGRTSVLHEIRAVKVKAGEKKQIEFPLARALFETQREPLSWLLKSGSLQSKPFRVYFAPLRDEAPRVDGRLDEWEGMPMLELGHAEQLTRGFEGWSPEKASARVGLWFTPEQVFVAARVFDDDPIVNEHPPNLIWRGDALELYLGFGGPARRTVLNKQYDFQLGVAPTCDLGRPIVFLFHEDRILETARVVAQPADAGYILEAAIPLSEFGAVTLEDGALLGFDVALTDFDRGDWAPEGNMPGRALMWNGTGMNWIDPSGWGMAVLGRD